MGGKTIGDIYGAEHLCRLLGLLPQYRSLRFVANIIVVTLPELIAQTNMDQQSVNRLREELAKFTAFISKRVVTYFVNAYETPNTAYLEKARRM
jgi:mortality factor 4-like protein 1